MTAGQWKRIKAVASEAWSRPAPERPAYVTHACAGDDALSQDVLSLVAAMADAEGRFETSPRLPAAIAALASLCGRRVGPYEILSRSGAGGMGEVYKARDTRLDRIVAIKVLAAHSANDLASRERMEREARAVAALNHPHICTLHDIGSDDGIDFLVMEYLEGETLAVRLRRGRLPVDEALRYAEQIASALLEAHRRGIVHRDVKPGNILLTSHSGRPAAPRLAKLLDFGLARATPSDIAVDALPQAPRPGLPTAAAPATAVDLTDPGFVIGTAPYMAPEQVERNEADARTDVFAFGAVLFEMLTGSKPFKGSSPAEVLTASLDEERPRVASFGWRVPPALDRLVTRCLAREPEARYQTFDALLAQVRAIRQRIDSSSRALMLARTSALSILLVGGAVTWAVWPGRASAPALVPSVTRLAASVGVTGAPALSPDGSTLVFSWFGEGIDNPELVLLRIGTATRVRLTSDPGVEEWPAWSPDGTRIAFVRCATTGGCAILTLPVDGGPEHKLLELPNDRYYGLAWSPDGRSIAYAARPALSEPYALFLLSLETLSTRRLTAPLAGGGELRFAFSPDGQTLAVVRISDGIGIGVHLVSLATGTSTALLSGQQEWFGGITWSADGQHLILSANQQGIRRLWKLPLAGGGLEQLAVAGENAYFPSVSSRGERLAFVHEFRDWDLWRMSLTEAGGGAQSRFPSSPRLDLDPAFSRDGEKLAFVSERSGTREIWVSQADGSEPLQLTSFNGPPVGKPSWSGDGRWLAFHANGIHVIAAAGGPPRRITDDGELPSWSADGRWLYFVRSRPSGFRVWKVSSRGGSAIQVIDSEASVAREGPRGEVYFARAGGGIWRAPGDGGPEVPVVPDFRFSLPGYWTVLDDGIYYLAEEGHADRGVSRHIAFFDFASRRTSRLGAVFGTVEDWVGGLTVSRDRRTLVYSQRTYHSSEIVLVERFR